MTMQVPGQDSRRVTELVQELVGAQMIAKMLAETWDALGPEHKAKIAEALAEATVKYIKDNSYGLREHIQSAMGTYAKAAVEAKRAELEQAIATQIAADWDRQVATVATDMLRRALDEVRQKYMAADHGRR